MFQKLISGNHLLATFTLVFSFGMNHYLKLDNALEVALFLSLGIFLVYNFQQQGLHFFKSTSALLVSIVLVILAFHIPFNFISLVILLLNILLSILYVYPSRFSLRKIPFIKLFVIAFCWTSCFVIFPQTLFSSTWNWSLIIMMYFFFSLLALPFDIHQLEKDKKTIQTIPVKLGLKKSQYLMYVLLLLFFTCNLYQSVFSLNNVFYWVLIIHLTSSICFIHRIQSNFLIFLLFDTLLILCGLALFLEK